jgi:spore photoproduct lyase
MKVPVKATTSHNRVTGITGKTATESYREAKRTLVIGVRRSKTFQTCKPSAHYQLTLTTSCPGMCEYCYLATTLGQKPYVRVYVNLGEILEIANELIKTRSPEITIFEGAATSDPLPSEKYTGSLKKTIDFFGKQPYGRFRFVTKFTDVESLLDAKHNGHTRFRFSLNCEDVIREYEHGTPSATERITAASKVLQAGYPLGFIIAPIFKLEDWKDQYTRLFILLEEQLSQNSSLNWSPENLTFEFITHRFTTRAKSTILKVFPQTKLQMEEHNRKYKFGQFGYGKYVYQPDEMDELKSFFLKLTHKHFTGAGIEYFV